ncbi:MAG: hypothetical protein U5R31_16455 [Acidimicrobiia bacterium]|nr:hypothetical protein [Acidimicrobiia bacterium]
MGSVRLRPTRRAVLLGGAGTLLLAACGNGNGGASGTGGTASSMDLEEAGTVLQPTFNTGAGYASAGVPSG